MNETVESFEMNDQDDEDDGILLEPIRQRSLLSCGGHASRSCCAIGGGGGGCVSCVTLAYTIVHPILTAILLVMVLSLTLQTSTLTQQLAEEDAAIAHLQEELTRDQETQQNLGEAVQQEHSLTLYQISGTFTLLTCLITTFHMTQHLSNFHEPVIQRKIVAILWMSPIYSITSFLSLVFSSANEYLAVVKDFYEAYVIYTFLSFLISVLGRGNRDTAVSVLANHADHLPTPTKCLRSCYHPPPETSNNAKAAAVLMECQIMALQFVMVRPITSLLRVVADTFLTQPLVDEDEQETYTFFKSPEFYMSMLVNISVFFAFNGLLKFYHAVQEDLKWCQPFNKFMAIKGIVFLTFWQGLLISIIVNLNNSGNSSASSRTAAPYPDMDMTSTPTMSPYHTLEPTIFIGTTMDMIDGGNRTLYTVTKDENNFDNDAAAAAEHSALIQNFLICLEMLLFSIAHWCVFPSEEWEPGYAPKQNYAKPGIAIKDFAEDISYIVSSSTNARRYRREARSRDDESSHQSDDGMSRNQEMENVTGVVVLSERDATTTIPEFVIQDSERLT